MEDIAAKKVKQTINVKNICAFVVNKETTKI